MDFTNEEKERINQLYGNDFKDVTPEDMPLIRRWERFNALNDAEFQARKDAITAESAARIKALDSKVKTARNNLNELKAAALARLERIDNGK